MNQYKPPCSSKAADGAIRGALIGLVWGGVFASPPLPAEAGASVGASALKRAGRVGGSMLRHGGGFAAFLAVYNGVTCTAEKPPCACATRCTRWRWRAARAASRRPFTRCAAVPATGCELYSYM